MLEILLLFILLLVLCTNQVHCLDFCCFVPWGIAVISYLICFSCVHCKSVVFSALDSRIMQRVAFGLYSHRKRRKSCVYRAANEFPFPWVSHHIDWKFISWTNDCKRQIAACLNARHIAVLHQSATAATHIAKTANILWGKVPPWGSLHPKWPLFFRKP